MLAKNKATLPNGTVVEVSINPDERWETHFATFYVRPGILLPDPTQPREYIDPDTLEELKESISEVGVRDTIIVTPTSHVP